MGRWTPEHQCLEMTCLRPSSFSSKESFPPCRTRFTLGLTTLYINFDHLLCFFLVSPACFLLWCPSRMPLWVFSPGRSVSLATLQERRLPSCSVRDKGRTAPDTDCSPPSCSPSHLVPVLLPACCLGFSRIPTIYKAHLSCLPRGSSSSDLAASPL